MHLSWKKKDTIGFNFYYMSLKEKLVSSFLAFELDNDINSPGVWHPDGITSYQREHGNALYQPPLG